MKYTKEQLVEEVSIVLQQNITCHKEADLVDEVFYAASILFMAGKSNEIIRQAARDYYYNETFNFEEEE